MTLSSFGRKFYKLMQLIERPKAMRLQLTGISPETYLDLARPWFLDRQFDTVFDVGANKGQFAASVATALPSARVFSIEPLPDVYSELVTLASRYPNIKPINCGVGSSDGSGTIHQNVYSDSSSFRLMKPISRQQFPFTEGRDVPVQVAIRTLDGIASQVPLGSRTMVKIDVQGFEDEVIRGAPKVLGAAEMVIIEVSFVSLYDGSPTFDQVNGMLREHGLRFAGCIDQLVGPLDGSILQGDALFIRDH